MTFNRDVVGAIGRTPLIRLRAASEATGCTILGKAEFMNPGGSVKDRAALAIIRDAAERGALRPGGVIVEGTAGNTGIGIAMVAGALGYRSVIVIPDTQSQEKKDMLRLAGAELIEVPAVPYSNPNNYVRYSGRLAEALAKTEPNGAVWANQFDNVANRRGHYETTGPEIFDELDGKVDGFVSAVGSGGTLAGVGMALKERDPRIKIALADPMGAALYSYYTTGELKSSGSSITEGIGQGRVTANLEGAPVDFAFQIPDEEALPIVFDLVVEEGLLLGGSSGINIAGAIRLARELGPGHTIVTLLCDSGARYASKLFNPAFPALEEPARSGLARGEGTRSRGFRPMTEPLFRDDAYLRETPATVVFAEPRGIALDRTVFYPQGGGQPGDQGTLVLDGGGTIAIVNTIYDADRKTILHVPAEGAALPAAGAAVVARIDWDRRYRRMRAHTALHLLSVVLPYPVTGGSVGDAEGRLDFDCEAPLDKAEVERKLNELIALDAPVTQRWITDEELDGQSGAGQDDVGQAADRNRPRPSRRDRGPRPAALRGHACRAHRRNRPRLGHPDREEGPDQPPRAHRARSEPEPDGHGFAQFLHDGRARRRARRPRPRRDRRLVASAQRRAARGGRVPARAYSRRGLFRHRHDRRSQHPACRTCCRSPTCWRRR